MIGRQATFEESQQQVVDVHESERHPVGSWWRLRCSAAAARGTPIQPANNLWGKDNCVRADGGVAFWGHFRGNTTRLGLSNLIHIPEPGLGVVFR